MKLKSKAFEDGGMIPIKYTCDGVNVSPPLQWEDISSETVSLALICDDPDAPSKVWTHWVIFNLPADGEGLDEAIKTSERLENGAIQGLE